MKQRVGVARALVVEPEVLFMDEPFSALDVLTAETLRGELLELWLENKIPTRAIFIVTHNIEEAVVLADRIIVLGRNPAHIHADLAVNLSYPRDRKSPSSLNWWIPSTECLLVRMTNRTISILPRTATLQFRIAPSCFRIRDPAAWLDCSKFL